MKSTGAKIKLGLFVSIGLIIFILAIYSVGKQQKLFGTTFSVNTLFYDVSGLQVGNNVRFSGIRVGVVNNITIISDSLVKVEMLIEEEVRKFIKKDSRAVIGSEGLMGNKVVNILAGNPESEIIANHDMINSEKPIDIDNLLLSVKVTVDNIENISSDLAEITNSVATGRGIVGALLMDTVVTGHLEKSMRNIQEGTKGFEENMEALQDNVLLRGHFRKKEKQQEKEQKQLEKEEEKQRKQELKEESRENGNGKRGLFGGKKE